MNGKIHKALERFHADQALVQKTFENITGKRKKSLPLRYKLVPASALCALLLLSGLYLTPVAYISIDINPSIELSLNAFDIVIKAQAINADGQDILSSVNLKNLNYVQALEKLDLSDGFSDYSDRYTEITVIANSAQNSESMVDDINSSSFSGQNVSCHFASDVLKEQAEHSGMSFGKYRAYIELSEIDSSVAVEDIHHLSMAEIRQLIEGGEIAEDNAYNGDNSHHDNAQGQGGNASEGSGGQNENGNGQGHQHGKDK